MASDWQRIEIAAARYGPTIEHIAKGYTNPVTGARLSGQALLLKLIKGESGGKRGQVSPAGARGWSQFMPGSRAVVLNRFGVDPWRSPEEAVHAAALHLRGKVNGSTGLEGYNPGMPTYAQYILGQKVGPSSLKARVSIPSAAAATTSSAPAFDPGATTVTSPAVTSPARIASAGLATPEFAARAATPEAYRALQTGGVTPPQTTEAVTEQAAGSGGVEAAPAVATTTPAAANVAAKTLGLAFRKGLSAAESVQVLANRASALDAKRFPYKWGGGHAGRVDIRNPIPVDCSGAVSAVLGIDPRVSGQFERWGSGGRSPSGKGVTIYANSEHVLMEINGKFFGTSASNPGGGAGWIPRGKITKAYLSRFTARHARSLEP